MTIINDDNDRMYETIMEWLKEYHSSKDQLKRKRLKALISTRMLPVVRKIAHRIARRSYDPIDDMVQAGAIGLLKAIDTFEPEDNDNFKIYAGYFIIGEMKHFLRDKLTLIRVPGYVQELAYRINTFTSTLTLDELNELTNDDVAEALNVSTATIDYVKQADRRKRTISLEDIFASDSDNLGFEEMLAKRNYKEESANTDAKLILHDLIEQLEGEDKKLMEMYYYQDLSQVAIAEMTNMTKMQIHRKFKKIFTTLYEIIASQPAGEK